jgi:hypothetical protein
VYTALRSTSLTLSSFLQQEFRSDVLLRSFFDPVHGGTMEITLNSPPEMADNRDQGLSVWLYRVERDAERLNIPPERIALDRLHPRPLPVRLHYLLTPLADPADRGGVETEQLILGKVLQLFHDHPTLRGVDLRDDFTGMSVELNVRLESFSLDDTARVREMLRLETSYELAVSYEVSVVYIESARETEAVSPVMVPIPEYGLVVGGEGDGS